MCVLRSQRDRAALFPQKCSGVGEVAHCICAVNGLGSISQSIGLFCILVVCRLPVGKCSHRNIEACERQRKHLQNEYIGQAGGKFVICSREILKKECSVVNTEEDCDSVKHKLEKCLWHILCGLGATYVASRKIITSCILHKIAQSITCQLSSLLVQHKKGSGVLRQSWAGAGNVIA